MSGTPPWRSLAEACRALRTGEISAVDLTRYALGAVTAFDERCGAYLDRYDDTALEAAVVADAELRAGDDRGPLHGIPLAVKDLISTADGPTTAQSLVHDPRSVTGDAPVVARLRAAGMIVVGKTTTMEFGLGRHDPEKPFPQPRNPWSLAYSTGGSSAGSASAVAMSPVLAALGTDTGGSVRIPSAFCGVSGLKPTYGRVSKSGVVPYVYSLDTVGPIARTAQDCALLLSVMASLDPADPTSVDRPVPIYETRPDIDFTGRRIGVDRLSRHAPTVDPAVASAFESSLSVLTELGATLVEVELPYYEEATEAYMVTALGEAFAYHAPDLEHRWEDYFAATRTTIGSAAFYTAADYVQAQRVRAVIRRAASRFIDLIVTPTTSITAPSIEKLDDYFTRQGQRSVHTLYWNVIGNPALSVPMGFNDEGLPCGLQIAGRPFDEAMVLRAGIAYQQLTDWHERLPPIVHAAS